MALTDARCRALKPKTKLYKESDSAGLQLWVFPNGSRLWRLAYRWGNKQKSLALGAYPEVGLSEARTARDDARRLLRAGTDPSEQRRNAKRQRVGELTFSELADEFLTKQVRAGKAASTLKKTAWHISHANASFGARAAAMVLPADVLAAAMIFERRGNFESANRFKGVVGAVFRHGVATAKCATDPTASLRGALIRKKPMPRAAILEPKKVGPLLRAIDGCQSNHVVRAALKILPLVFLRVGELRQAEWSDIDFAERVWTIPAARTKMRRPLSVPLANQVIAMLRDLQDKAYSDKLVFPSLRNIRKPISDGTLNAALQSIGYPKEDVTPHGFRATASTLLNESGRWHRDAIERQLAHVDKDSVRAAYARGEHWSERVKMMQWWADYLDELKRSKPTLALVV